MDRLTRITVLCALLTAGAAGGVQAQFRGDGEALRAPRFFLALGSSRAPLSVEPSQAPALLKRISIDLPDATLREALDAVASRSSLHLMYSSAVAPLDRRVRLQAQDVTVAAALTQVLLGAGVDVMFTGLDRAVLVPRAPEPVRSAPGAIIGRVTEAGSGGGPVVNARVAVDGAAPAFTDAEGHYRIANIEPGRHTVTVASIGYERAAKEVDVGDGETVTVDFAVEVAPTALTELVVTATGPQRRLEVGNDIVVIRADEVMAERPVMSVTDLLEGRVPGLVLHHTSGAPGDPVRLRLRGVSSALMSNDPIIVVDGVRVYSQQSDERGGNLAASPFHYAAPSPLDYIDPHSIETIQVIKGPSAATLYGQDAANGVIVITTKRGQAGPARWTVGAEYGIREAAGDYPELFVAWGREYGSNTRVYCPASWAAYVGRGCVQDTLMTYQLLDDPEKTVLDRGHGQGLTFGVSGGSPALTYSVRGSYGEEVGLIALPAYEIARYRESHGSNPPDWMQRPQHLETWSASSRVTARLGERADVSLTAQLSRTMQQRSSLENRLGELMTTFFDPTTGTYYRSSGTAISEEEDAVLERYSERVTSDATRFMNAVSLNWRPFGWLSTTADAGLDVVQRADEHFVPRGADAGFLESGHLSSGQGSSIVTTLNARATSRLPLGRGLELDLAAGLNYSGQSTDDVIGQAEGLVPGTESPVGAEETSFTRRVSEGATFGWYIQPTLSGRRFWLSPGIRFDGGSTLGSDLRFPIFPKVSASYLVSEEPFFPAALRPVFNTLRLRAAYGHAGRQPGPTDRLRLYGPREAVRVGGRLVDAVVLETLGNTKLKPERSEEIEAGVDADLFDDRLSLSFTYYRKNTTDMLLDAPVAPSVYGDFVTVPTNVGRVRNTGTEGRLAAQLVRSGPVTWDVDVSWSRNRNEVLELGPGVEPFYARMESLGKTGIRVAAGYPLFSRWTRPILGYADLNGDGRLVPQEVMLGDTMVYVGGTLPDYTAALNTTLSLLRGAVSVTAGLLYEDGMTQRNEVVNDLGPLSRGWNDASASLEEQLATLYTATEYNWIQVVNSLRFNNLSMTFHVPSPVARRFGAQALSVSVQGSNLGLWTNYRGLDPNVNAYGTGNDVTDNGVLPRPRTWQVRVNASY